MDKLLDNRKKIQYLINNNKAQFTVKTLDEMLSLLEMKGEKEFSIEIFHIFGQNNNDEYTNEMVKTFGVEVAKKTVNFREILFTLAFFRMESYHGKITST